MKILAAWLGNTDIESSKAPDSRSIEFGPIAEAMKELSFEQLVLLTNYSNNIVDDYIKWLGKHFNISVDIQHIILPDPTEYRTIYLAVTSVIDELLETKKNEIDLTCWQRLATKQP